MKKRLSIIIVLAITLIISIYFIFFNTKDNQVIENLPEAKENLVETIAIEEKQIIKSEVTKVKTKKEPTIQSICKEQTLNKEKVDYYFCLAKSGKWKTSNIKILTLTNNNSWSIAHELAAKNSKWQSDDETILKLKDKNGNSVAHILARYNSNWQTNAKDILELSNVSKESVAHFLAIYNINWSSQNKEILNLTTNYGATVKSILAKRHKLINN